MRESKAGSGFIVDGEASIVLSLEFVIRNAGFEVRMARDGDEALRAGDSVAETSKRQAQF